MKTGLRRPLPGSRVEGPSISLRFQLSSMNRRIEDWFVRL